MSKNILGNSTAIKDLLEMIRRVASSKTSILIYGESGTGKELVARMIHEVSSIKERPFVPVNCGAIPETLIESEMFGHKKGSFTGASHEKMGLFEAASGGTLFLDEIGELSLSMQVKLLRALQERTIRKVGGTDDIKVDVRIVAATNRNLEEAIQKDKFREDLFYRINVISINTPSLRERKSDIPLLAEYFLTRAVERSRKSFSKLEPEVYKALEAYDWPGNVRELENVIERAVALESASTITMHSMPHSIELCYQELNEKKLSPNSALRSAKMETPLILPAADFSQGNIDLDKILVDVERSYLLKALEHVKGTKKNAAKLLGLTFRSLRYRLKKQGLESPEAPDSIESED